MKRIHITPKFYGLLVATALTVFLYFIRADVTQQPSVEELYQQWRIEFENHVKSRYAPGIYPAMWARRDANFLNAYQNMVHSADPKLNWFLYTKAKDKHALIGDCILTHVLCERMGWDLHTVCQNHPNSWNEYLAICAEFERVSGLKATPQ